MSDLRDHLEINVPLSLENHKEADCLNPMACEVCMTRCYPQRHSHYFEGDGTRPCACGKFRSLREATG